MNKITSFSFISLLLETEKTTPLEKLRELRGGGRIATTRDK